MFLLSCDSYVCVFSVFFLLRIRDVYCYLSLYVVYFVFFMLCSFVLLFGVLLFFFCQCYAFGIFIYLLCCYYSFHVYVVF